MVPGKVGTIRFGAGGAASGLGTRGGEDAGALPTSVLLGGSGSAGPTNPPAVRHGVQTRDPGRDRPGPRDPAGSCGSQVVGGGFGSHPAAWLRAVSGSMLPEPTVDPDTPGQVWFGGYATDSAQPNVEAFPRGERAGEPASRHGVRVGVGTGDPARCLPPRVFVAEIDPAGHGIEQTVVAADSRCSMPVIRASRSGTSPEKPSRGPSDQRQPSRHQGAP